MSRERGDPKWWQFRRWRAIARHREMLLRDLLVAGDSSWHEHSGGHDYLIASNNVRSHLGPRCAGPWLKEPTDEP